MKTGRQAVGQTLLEELADLGITPGGSVDLPALAELGVQGVLCSKEYRFTEQTAPGSYQATMSVAEGTVVAGMVVINLGGAWVAGMGSPTLTVSDAIGAYFYGVDLSAGDEFNLPYNPASSAYHIGYRRGWFPSWALENAADFNKFTWGGIDTGDFAVIGPGRRYATSDTITLTVDQPNAAAEPAGDILVRVMYFMPQTPTSATFTQS